MAAASGNQAKGVWYGVIGGVTAWRNVASGGIWQCLAREMDSTGQRSGVMAAAKMYQYNQPAA